MVGRVPVALKITFFLYQLNKNDKNKRKTLWLVKKKIGMSKITHVGKTFLFVPDALFYYV